MPADDTFDPARIAAMPRDQVCAYCHHLLTRHYGAGDVEATGCGQLGCPCLHSGRGPGLTPAEAALIPPRVRSTVTTTADFPTEWRYYDSAQAIDPIVQLTQLPSLDTQQPTVELMLLATIVSPVFDLMAGR